MIDLTLDDFQIFKDNKTTLKETSKNRIENRYMTNCLYEAVNFDGVKNAYIKGIGPEITPKSNDALFYWNEKLWFIEFKDGNMRSELKTIRRKIFESLLIFSAITDKTIDFTRTEMNYILVYNKEKSQEFINKNKQKLGSSEIQESPSFDVLADNLGGLQQSPFDFFSLRPQFEKMYFYRVYTYSSEEFNQKVNEYEQNSCSGVPV